MNNLIMNIILYAILCNNRVGVDLVLAQSRRRWAGIGSTVVRCLVFIYMNLMTLPHGTTFLEHVSIKFVTRFYCIPII